MSFLASRTRAARDGVGKPLRRLEDARLVAGQGCYSDDFALPGQVYAFMVRSPHAHARLGRIDATALTTPGVIAVFAGRDAAEEDYAIPRADAFPPFVTEMSGVPSTSNPLGLRGGGEGGTTPALGAVINAVVDALAELGVEHLDMPATPERVWRAIHEARTARTRATSGP